MAEVKLDNFTNNSDSARRANQDVPRETESYSPPEKSSFMRRMADRRFAFSENFEGAGQMVLEEVIIPTLVDGLRDVIYAATDYILYGGSQRRGRSGGNRRNGSYTSYSKKSQRPTRKVSPSSSAYYITYDDRSEAEDVLSKMRDVVDTREFVTIMDMFSVAGKQTNNYTYNSWGWSDLRTAYVRRTTDGRYYIDLPKPVPIED